MIKKRKCASGDISYLSEEEEIPFSKKNKVKEKLKQCQKEKEEYLAQLQRTRADFINYRKRQEQLSEVVLITGKASLISDLLPVLDALEAGAKKNKDIARIEGLFRKSLKAHKIEKIETKGKNFDYRLHEAVSRKGSDKEEGTILEEVQSGYIIGEQVLRPSKVVISN